MSQAVRVVWDDALVSYDFGPGHPLAPVRVELTMALARDLGVLDGTETTGCAPATEDEIALVHNRDYIEAVKNVSKDGRPDLRYGLGTEDNPAFVGVHEASALVTGASLAAARAVWTGEAEHAVNVAGGLHHAMPGAASGFCVYNDPAVAIAWLLSQGATRIAYVDVDVHHGDGVQAAFYDDPRVLTISLHESPRTLFPGTGFPQETGAEGTAVNVALPAGCGDTGWLRAFHAVVPPLLHAFAPQILVTQQGCDSHALDPLAHLMLSLDGQRTAYAALHRLAHETAGGRWVAVGGGGYELVQVVPRAWTHLIAEALGRPVEPSTATPDTWRTYVGKRTGEVPPLTMTDGRHPQWRDISEGYDPADAVDRAVIATRKAVFPFHGLDPMP
ncbi:acetoin utilization protein AcuC [Microbispora bryophytorum]|uniref:acetoin utilization protein AcuC n=1 Tax=Microbispora bryophytorum TaxID=1460882 RepID=UPI00115C4453|nr:acetoin utilization protein AcuC [Microbispora bryophytorum]MBD3135600.1 acetoin utilization protein AcuC [Microbispora bryophytorum]TQS09779.1 acetoin utilization protein AcuC [Microbispora bryophytorum]